MQLSDEQRSAIDFAVNSRFAIINGGAGVGKTTVIKEIANAIGSKTKLCAFAGKAAARLREATGVHASTIHSLLRFQGEGRGFTLDTLDGYAVIIDEASMIDSLLLAEIVRRNPSKLILVGDEDQLPPVGMGQPFHDLVACLPFAVRTLKTCWRNSEAIYHAAQSIRSQTAPAFREKTENELWEFRSLSDEAAHNDILDAVKSGEIDFGTDIVLCCRNGIDEDEPCAVKSLNLDIKAIVNPASAGDPRPPLRRLDPGDRVICGKNNPQTDTWNGTTGEIACFDDAKAMWVRLDTPTASGQRDVMIQRSNIDDWSLGYALTVHKAQGSQYRRVWFTCLMRDVAVLLDRPMLYTAVTRAKSECHLVGNPQAFHAAIARREPKRTCIQEFSK